MRNYAQPVMRIGDESLTLQQEYDMYLNGEVASDYDEENPLTYWVTVHPTPCASLSQTSSPCALLSGHFRTIRTRLFSHRSHINGTEIPSLPQIC